MWFKSVQGSVLVFSLTFFTHLSILAQTLELQKAPYVYYSQRLNCFRAFSDSLIYTLDPKAGWKKETLTVKSPGDSIDYWSEFFMVSNRGRDFMVNRGCGQVFELKGNQLTRLDHSFNHRNQYNAAVFFHHGDIHFFGGYGLFTSKNVITYFDFKKQEWFITFVSSKQSPNSRSSCYHRKIGDKLYIFGGYASRNSLGIFQKDVWTFNFSTSKWSKLGKINPVLSKVFDQPSDGFPHESPYIRYGSRFFVTYPKKNMLEEYISDEFARVVDVISDAKGNLLVVYRESNGFVSVKQLNEKAFLGKRKAQHELYITEQLGFMWIFVSVGVVLLVVVLFLLIRRKKRITNNLTDQDIQLCSILSSNGEEGVELSALNVLLDDGQSNYEALKKRRELKIRDLRVRLSEYSGISKEEVILEKKSTKDKRVKLFYLNPTIKLK